MFLLGMLFKENTLFLEHCTLLVAYKTLISSITIHSVLFFSQTCECIYYNTKNNVHPNNNNKQEKGNIKEKSCNILLCYRRIGLSQCISDTSSRSQSYIQHKHIAIQR